MGRKTVEVVTCDMCGSEIDVSDDRVRRASILSQGYYSMPVWSHNEAYSEGLRDGVEWAKVDLCPECVRRATAIRMDVREDGDDPCTGRSRWSYSYSWKEPDE